MRQRLTAQLVLSDSEAVLAYSFERSSRGQNGEHNELVLLHTTDAGETWNAVPMKRTLLDHVWRWGFPTWPPEAALELSSGQSGIEMIFRDEWAPYDRGDESLWRAAQRPDGIWTTRRIRFMDYENSDSPVSIDPIPLKLPAGMKPPGESGLKSHA